MFTTYSASAGSGKTTNLVADYIALCFQNDARRINQTDYHHTEQFVYQQILAITFTNNASAEMKERIVNTLNTFAFSPTSQYDNGTKAIYNLILDKLFGNLHPKEEIAENFIRQEAIELLRCLLYDYARFTLTTIDSFFQHLIRSSALSFDLSINYAVQIDLDEFYDIAIDQLINELNPQNPLTDRIVFLLNNSMEDTGKLNIDAELESSLNLLYANAEKNYEYLKILKNINIPDFKDKIKNWRKAVKEIPAQLYQQISPLVKSIEQIVSPFESAYYANFLSWISKVQNDSISNYVPSMDKYLKDGSLVKKNAKLTPDQQQTIDADQLKISDLFQQIATIQEYFLKKYLDAKLLTQNADKLLILLDLENKMNEIKVQNNFFILSESNTLIYENIRDQETPPLFEQFKYHHFFIDEFQDTSLMQWKDLKPLLKNNAIDTNGNITLFGDVKQAIYRFRNGDADLFNNLSTYETFSQDVDFSNVARQYYQNISLQNNYRSHKSIVEFNNGFFSYFADELGFQDYYQDVQQIVKKNELGMVRIFVHENDNDSDSTSLISSGDEPLGIMTSQTLAAVNDALNRGYEYQDIAVLMAGNDKCSAVTNLLLKEGMRVITAESLTLNASPAVNIIIYTLKYLIHPHDILVKASILFFLLKLQHDKTASLSQILLSLKNNQDFDHLLQKQVGSAIPTNEWQTDNLFILIKKITHFYQLDTTADPFIVDFENLILSYLDTNNGNLDSFLNWWQKKIDHGSLPSLSLPNGINAITVSTIHKSKGLEYPVVILPYTSGNNHLHPKWIAMGKETVGYIELSDKSCTGSSFEQEYRDELNRKTLDDLNLLYVAHTRAKDCLYIITKKSKGSGTKYGDQLYSYLHQNEESTHENGGLQFTQDTDDNRFHYAGDRNWQKPDKRTGESEMPHNLSITTSTFDLQKIKINYSLHDNHSGQREIGLYVHDFLAKLQSFPQNQNEIEQVTAEIPEERKQVVKEALGKILTDETLKLYFAPDAIVLNEKSILDKDGRTYRPDRIVFLRDQVMVLDYKTGQDNPQYQEQIDNYCSLLQQMGYANVKGRLVFI